MRIFLAVMVFLCAFALSARDYGKCSFNSDCNPNVKCNSGVCADAAGANVLLLQTAVSKCKMQFRQMLKRT